MEKVKLKELASRSVFGSVGTLLSEKDLVLFISYVKYNKNFLSHFPEILYSFNGDSRLIDQVGPLLKEILSNNIHILTTENLGHTFGTFLNDRNIISYADQLPYDYIWKFSNDVVVKDTILDKEVSDNFGFYYINNIGYNVFNTYPKQELLSVLMSQEFYYPQTNYYIIKNHINFYPDLDTIMDLKEQYETAKITNPGIQPWHAIQGCDCEHMLAKTVEQNNLSKKYLLSEQSTKTIIDFIHERVIHDGSHKNIAYSELGDLCHLHHPNDISYLI